MLILLLRMGYVTNGLTFCVPFQGFLHFWNHWRLSFLQNLYLPLRVYRFISDDERALVALPIRLGGLGIVDPQTVSDSEFAASEKVTSPLVGLILQQDMSFHRFLLYTASLRRINGGSTSRGFERLRWLLLHL